MPEVVFSKENAEAAPRSMSRRSGRARWGWLALGTCLMATLVAAARMHTGEYLLELGPYTLPAHSGHGAGGMTTPLATTLDRDGWVRGLSYELVDEQGEQLPAGILHHVNLIAPERRELFSPIMLRIGAAGGETKPYSLPFFLGYRVRRGDSLLVTAMLHNPTARPYRGVRLRLRLDFTPGNSLVRPWSIQPMYLDVTPPSDAHSFDLPPGRSSMSWEGQPAIPARLLAAGGHLHQYATALRFEDLTLGELIWEARPELGADGGVEGMPTRYFLPAGVLLRPDHRYRLTAEYDNPTGKVLPNGGMGALGGIVMPTSGSSWPAAVRDDSVYQHDVWMTTGPGAPHRRAGGHHH
jgi:hypothetical protein